MINDELRITKKPACPKCGGLLRRDTVTMIGEGTDYAVEDEIKCLACGWRIARPAEDYLGKFRDLPIKSVKGHVCDTRPKGLLRDIVAKLNIQITGCCAVVTCAKLISSINKSGLCKCHSNKQRQWEISKQTTPSPFIPAPDQPGKVMHNPACSGMRSTITSRSVNHAATDH